MKSERKISISRKGVYNMQLHYAGLTHHGKVRENNEDTFYADGIWREDVRENEFFACGKAFDGYLMASVCDGMGGEDLGEIASLIAVRSLHDLYHPENEENDPDVFRPEILLRNDPMRYVSLANGRVCEMIRKTGKVMGTTFSAVEFTPEGAAVMEL